MKLILLPIIVIIFLIIFFNVYLQNRKKVSDTNKTIVDEVLEMLEIKQAISIIDKQFKKDKILNKYIWKDNLYFIFERLNIKETNNEIDSINILIFNKVLLSRDFSIIKVTNDKNEIWGIIDLSKDRERIKLEFEELFEWLQLQYQGNIKLKKYMKDTLEEVLRTN